ncbi:3-ketoacyl- thiolase 2, peroxisomal [Olea europaea subsp. europaea]|uniref:acetyl-CoA C-acyltransferase n=1 Tax=Olea europaea subsp. europaea TaxID=158383 RepID=A0A8S0TE33_OLEEU|nr:3-ketoacyl- thiolase 2, peroxisomal [Olea europaea subsp. europaea]
MEKAIERQRVLLHHIRPSFTSSSLENIDSSISASVCSAGDSAAYHRTSVFGDDVVIVAAYRTALCKSKRGGFKDTYPDDLLAPVLRTLIEKTNVNPSEVGDIVVGTVLAPGSQRASECRMAAFYAGFPETVPVRTVNRQCSSGLQAVADVAAAIKAGFYDIGIGAGLESMTANPMAWEGDVNPRVKSMEQAQNCLLPMGVTSENVAHRFGVTRQEQDQAAVESHRKAAAATASGKFKEEIVPVKTKASVCSAGDSAAYHRTSVFGDDVVIVAAYRTALCKSKRGGFKDTYPDDLLAPVLRTLIEKTNVNPSEVGDIVVGTVLAPGSQRASECRMAAFYAGFPETVPVRTVNRQCSSGLQAVADVAAAIKAGFYDIGIGAGLESMTANPMAWEGDVNPRVKSMEQAQNCLLPMGVTSENVARRFGVTRQEQDQAAVESHRKAAAATASGKFKEEIVPVKTKIVDPKTGDEKPVTISVDDGIRPNTTVADLAKLKPVFKKDGSTTAGNSSQVSDGAGAVLLMKRSVAVQKGLQILGVFRSFAAVGVDPAIMGVGPAVAIPAAVKSAGLELDDIDLFEINEAFASQFVYCRKKLELDPEKINVNGGAMAIGHPLGATGARCVATLLHEMKRRGKDCRFGVISMCIGTGMGAAAVFERGDSCDDLSNARKVETHNFLSKASR